MNILQKHLKNDHVHMRLWMRFYGTSSSISDVGMKIMHNSNFDVVLCRFGGGGLWKGKRYLPNEWQSRILPFCFWNKSSEFGKNKFHYFPAKYYTYIFSPAPHPTPRYGYNNWRDPQKPSQILTKLCQHYKLDGPHFSAGKVRIGELTYCGEQFIDDEGGNGKCYLFLNDQLTLVTINIYRVSRKKRKHFFISSNKHCLL